jgi:hypothetical protein
MPRINEGGESLVTIEVIFWSAVAVAGSAVFAGLGMWAVLTGRKNGDPS